MYSGDRVLCPHRSRGVGPKRDVAPFKKGVLSVGVAETGHPSEVEHMRLKALLRQWLRGWAQTVLVPTSMTEKQQARQKRVSIGAAPVALWPLV